MAAYREALRASRRPDTRSPQLSLEQAALLAERRLTSGESLGLHHAIAAEAGVFPPSRVPAGLVADLFDRYAEKFDEHLRGSLEYVVPEIIAQAAARHSSDQLVDILDLGCGTGLCGPLLRPMAAMLGGVDLSGAMIDKAKERGVYDQLHVGDMLDLMKNAPATFDLLVAADSLIYLGDLAPVFEAATTALRPGGLFIFTLEQGEGDRYTFSQETRRFAHASGYVEKLAEMYAWRVEAIDPITPRLHAGKPVAGLLLVLKRPQ